MGTMNVLRKKMLVGVMLAASALCSAASATAEPGEAERERARNLVYHGDMLFAEKRYGEALEAYSSADEIMKVPTTSIEVAKVLASLGRLVEAREVAAQVEAHVATLGEPPPFTRARVRATELVRELDKRIPTVRLDIVPRVKTRKVSVDKQPVPDDLSWSPLRMDPGRHIISVDADGFAIIAQSVDLTEGEAAVLELKLPERTRGPGSIALASFIVSGVALTGATIAGAMYLDQQSTLEDACRRGTPDCDIDAIERADALGWTANVGFLLALAGAATGGVSYGLEASREATMEGIQMGAVVSPGFVGVQGAF